MAIEQYRLYEKLLLGEFILGVLGVLHFAIVYTYFDQFLTRGFIISVLLVLTAIILFIITHHQATNMLRQVHHANH